MRAKAFLTLTVACCGVLASGAQIVTVWDFNSRPPDFNTAVGTNLPRKGDGSPVAVFGGVTMTYASGANADPEGDNSAFVATSFAPQGLYNLGSGVEFHADAAGYTNLLLSWWHRNSATATCYFRLLCSNNGHSFSPGPVIRIGEESVWTNILIGLEGLPLLANNPRLAFKLVAEFESTATGAGTNGYRATGDSSSYSSAGTVRLDLLTLQGTLLPGSNSAPAISDIPSLALRVGQASAPIGFRVGDAQDGGDALTVTAQSSNPEVAPPGLMSFTGISWDRELHLVAGQMPGTSVVSVVVRDSGDRTATSCFELAVLPLNTPPSIAPIPTVTTVQDQPTLPIELAVTDLETSPAALEVWVSSAHPALVSDDRIGLHWNGTRHVVVLHPNPGQTGAGCIRVRASDGILATERSFGLMVRPSAEVLVFEPFGYTNGPVGLQSGGLWATRSGTPGDCEVRSGVLQLSGLRTEDISIALAGGPCLRSNGVVLHAGFEMVVTALPGVAPEYFAHFVNGSSLRGRVFIGTANAAPGNCRVGVSNGGTSPAMLPFDLATNRVYWLFLRYGIDSAETDLVVTSDPSLISPTQWPTQGVTLSGGAIRAADSQGATTIGGFGFRQPSGLGSGMVLIDHLRVGLTQSSVQPTADTRMLRWERMGSHLRLEWNPGWGLETAPGASGPWSQVLNATSPIQVNTRSNGAWFRLRSGP